MTNGMSPRTRHIVSGLAAVVTTSLLLSAVVNSFDPRLLTAPGLSESSGTDRAPFFGFRVEPADRVLAPRAGVEPTTCRLGGGRSIH